MCKWRMFCTYDFIALLCHITMKRNLFCRKKKNNKEWFLTWKKKVFVKELKRHIKTLPDISVIAITCSSQDSFAYNESLQDSYLQFPRSPLGTLGSMPSVEKKASIFSRSAKASSTKQYWFNIYEFLEEKHAFVTKLVNRCFCWFPSATFVPIWMGTCMVFPYKSPKIWVKHFSGYLIYEIYTSDLNLGEGLCIFTSFHSQILDSGLPPVLFSCSHFFIYYRFTPLHYKQIMKWNKLTLL